MIRSLEQKLTSLDRGRTPDLTTEIDDGLRRLSDTLEGHFAREEKTPLFTRIPDESPRHGAALAHLLAEHQTLREMVKGLIAPGSTPGTGEIRRFLRTLKVHEIREDDLLQEVYGDDLGAVD